jgi:uncharacterized protein (TIGR03435 family)
MRKFILLFLMLAPYIFADGPEFEAAAIKPFDPNGAMRSSGGPGTSDPTHMNARGGVIRNLLTVAFNVKSYQLANADALTDMFDFALVVPAGATKEDLNLMWRNLLISRFGLKYHVEQREFQVDELTVGPKGHKLLENNEPEPPTQANESPRLTIGKDGQPTLSRPGLVVKSTSTPAGRMSQIVAKAQPISTLVETLTNRLGHPVVDKTGLSRKYDFLVEYSPETANPIADSVHQQNTAAGTADPSLDLSTALQQQLGLRLVKGKGKLDVFVIDKIERAPTEN